MNRTGDTTAVNDSIDIWQDAPQDKAAYMAFYRKSIYDKIYIEEIFMREYIEEIFMREYFFHRYSFFGCLYGIL